MNKNKVVLAGAGTMGASLAQVYALAGWDTVLYNRSQRGLDRAERLIELNQETLASEGIASREKLDEAKERILMTTDKALFSDAFLVVESVAEDMEVKRSFWYEVSRLVPEEALLATNTSGLHISEIAQAVHLPRALWASTGLIRPICCPCAS